MFVNCHSNYMYMYVHGKCTSCNCIDHLSLYSLLPLHHLSPLIAIIGDSHVMGWGSKAIEIRAVENGQLDGVFMHKRTQKLRFLCERNDKVG